MSGILVPSRPGLWLPGRARIISPPRGRSWLQELAAIFYARTRNGYPVTKGGRPRNCPPDACNPCGPALPWYRAHLCACTGSNGALNLYSQSHAGRSFEGNPGLEYSEDSDSFTIYPGCTPAIWFDPDDTYDSVPDDGVVFDVALHSAPGSPTNGYPGCPGSCDAACTNCCGGIFCGEPLNTCGFCAEPDWWRLHATNVVSAHTLTLGPNGSYWTTSGTLNSFQSLSRTQFSVDPFYVPGAATGGNVMRRLDDPRRCVFNQWQLLLQSYPYDDVNRFTSDPEDYLSTGTGTASQKSATPPRLGITMYGYDDAGGTTPSYPGENNAGPGTHYSDQLARYYVGTTEIGNINIQADVYPQNPLIFYSGLYGTAGWQDSDRDEKWCTGWGINNGWEDGDPDPDHVGQIYVAGGGHMQVIPCGFPPTTTDEEESGMP